MSPIEPVASTPPQPLRSQQPQEAAKAAASPPVPESRKDTASPATAPVKEPAITVNSAGERIGQVIDTVA